MAQSWWDWYWDARGMNTPENNAPLSNYGNGSAAAALWGWGTGQAGLEDSSGNFIDNDLNQSKYNFRYMMFPTDIGMSYMGHYMVININVPITITSGRSAGSTAEAATSLRRLNRTGPNATSQGGYFFEMLQTDLSKVDVLRFGNSNSEYGVSDSASPTQSDSFTTRRTRRIAESIALYMPGSQLVYTHQNEYKEQSLRDALAGVATGTANFIGKAGGTALATAARMPNATEFGDAAGQTLSDGLAGLGRTISGVSKWSGRPINPRVEVLFENTKLRTFTFEFQMFPRNSEEATAIRKIVQTLKFHMAPELNLYGMNFIPPAEFDITFFKDGIENTNIPRINTCVLMGLDVDYSTLTEGKFSTFEDGMPVGTYLRLQFQEVEPIHKLRALQGF